MCYPHQRHPRIGPCRTGALTSSSGTGRAVSKEPLNSNYISTCLWGVLHPLLNGGELAIVYCFIFLYFWLAGGGEWSLDRLRSPASTSAVSPSPT
jgi:hypothetical protein